MRKKKTQQTYESIQEAITTLNELDNFENRVFILYLDLEGISKKDLEKPSVRQSLKKEALLLNNMLVKIKIRRFSLTLNFFYKEALLAFHNIQITDLILDFNQNDLPKLKKKSYVLITTLIRNSKHVKELVFPRDVAFKPYLFHQIIKALKKTTEVSKIFLKRKSLRSLNSIFELTQLKNLKILMLDYKDAKLSQKQLHTHFHTLTKNKIKKIDLRCYAMRGIYFLLNGMKYPRLNLEVLMKNSHDFKHTSFLWLLPYCTHPLMKARLNIDLWGEKDDIVRQFKNKKFRLGLYLAYLQRYQVEHSIDNYQKFFDLGTQLRKVSKKVRNFYHACVFLKDNDPRQVTQASGGLLVIEVKARKSLFELAGNDPV